jgi:hypothetical protein
LERTLIADARDPVPDELRAHLASCAQCEARMKALARARAAYTAAQPAASFAKAVTARAAVTRVGPRPWLQRASWLSAALAAAAMAALGLRAVLPPAQSVDANAIRYKGARAEFEVFVKHGQETARPLRSGEALTAGDQLAFAYSLTQPQHLMLLGVDDAGTVTRYYPQGPLERSAALPAGARHQLPLGIDLDGRRGQERLVAFFSSTPLSEVAVRQALRSALTLGRARGQGVRDLGELTIEGTTQISVWFDKP